MGSAAVRRKGKPLLEGIAAACAIIESSFEKSNSGRSETQIIMTATRRVDEREVQAIKNGEKNTSGGSTHEQLSDNGTKDTSRKGRTRCKKWVPWV